ncbi:hypothetical protein H0H81_012438 [Sphagnurus paluster]|uniref:Novel STAND NTPase 1 domain-containing protein n=1 Tax=Sphagnurus paluster TaxID=117069 RepID=A0A9P7GNU8_9AGAR|nr:hypothetical protein H0H81_012438 [Sphagnurus paluster]
MLTDSSSAPVDRFLDVFRRMLPIYSALQFTPIAIRAATVFCQKDKLLTLLRLATQYFIDLLGSKPPFSFSVPAFVVGLSPCEKWRFGEACDALHKDETTLDAAEADLAKPTTKEYAGEAAKEFLVVLGAVAENIPIPGVKEAVTIAAKLIKACDDSHATLKRAQELKNRIQALVAVLVNELKDKKAEEIEEKLKQDIHALEENLTFIQKKLDEIASQHAFLVVFFRSLNEEKVRKCVDRLNNSLENFDVRMPTTKVFIRLISFAFKLARKINHANLLGQLEKQILAYHDSQKQELRNIQQDIKDTKVTMQEVKSMLSRRQVPAASSQGYAALNGIMPSNTRIFHGREKVVNELATILTRASPPWVCIMGPGGMGKTSTALAIMAHPEVKKSFPDQSQVWVPCVNATSINLLLDTLCLALGISSQSASCLKDIIEMLSSSQPSIILLDNFETPWNIDDAQARSQVERILYAINKIPHITIVVTMRSSNPPAEQIMWHSIDLQAVDHDAALQIYFDVYGDRGNSLVHDDPDLPGLLKMIGHMPLAVTLMAKAAKLTGLSAAKLAHKYEERGTAMLGPSGTDATHNMELCISLSVDSAPMKRVPEAFELLAILAMLPAGATFETLDTLWAQNHNKLMLALETLRDTSLVDHHDFTFLVLPVIRRYILDPLRFPNKVRESLVNAACRFLAQHKIDPRKSDGLYVEHVKAIAAEEANLQAILLETTTSTPRLIEALVTFARHQQATRPRTEVVEHALKLLSGLEDNKRLLGLALKCQADILVRQDVWDNLLPILTRARNLFLSIGDKREAAECTLSIVNFQRSLNYPDLKDPEAVIAEAQTEFESVGDRYGIALCRAQYGKFYSSFEESFVRSIEQFTGAMEVLVEFNDLPQIGEIATRIASTHYFLRNLEEARVWAERAIQQNEDIGRHDTIPTLIVGRVLIRQGDFAEALRRMAKCLEKTRGGRCDVAQMLEEMGRAWAKMGKKEDAESAFKQSMSYYSDRTTHPETMGRARCQYFIRKLSDPEALPSPAEEDALESWHPFNIDELL